MALVTTKEMFKEACLNNYAVGAFNVENMEMVMAVIQAAEEMSAPVILQTTPSTIKYAGFNQYASMVRGLAEESKVPVALHLDHGNSFDICMKALKAGYSSIMIDGSFESFDANIAISKKVQEVARAMGIPVEAELGKVGGKEDDIDGGDENLYTNPQEAVEFVKRTEVDSLAVGIGSAHGIYKGEPNIRIDILEHIHQLIDIPLVLHGTSGIPDEVVSKCVKNGIRKVNYATDLRIEYTKALREILDEDKEVFDPKKYGKKGIEYVKAYVKQKMQVCGCANRIKIK